MSESELADIYERHRRGLFAAALATTRCPARAEDAVHDAFARLCRGHVWKGDALAYVFSAVRNAAVDQVRRRSKHEELDAAGGSLFDFANLDPQQQAQDAERNRWVAGAIDDLPSDQREVVVLRVYGGLRFLQIAQVVHAPLATVTTRYRRALERLKGQLENVA